MAFLAIYTLFGILSSFAVKQLQPLGAEQALKNISHDERHSMFGNQDVFTCDFNDAIKLYISIVPDDFPTFGNYYETVKISQKRKSKDSILIEFHKNGDISKWWTGILCSRIDRGNWSICKYHDWWQR